MKHGAYVLFTLNTQVFKGRISISKEGYVYLCNAEISSGNCADKMGFEFALNLSHPKINKNDYIDNLRAYKVIQVTKKTWDATPTPKRMYVLGWTVQKTKDNRFSFGCGAVEFSIKEIREYIKHLPDYQKQRKVLDKKLPTSERDAITARLNKARAELNAFDSERNTAIANITSTYSTEFNNVRQTVEARGHRPENQSVEKLIAVFGKK